MFAISVSKLGAQTSRIRDIVWRLKARKFAGAKSKADELDGGGSDSRCYITHWQVHAAFGSTSACCSFSARL